MLRTRIIVALIFLPLLVWLIYLPNPLPLFLLAIISMSVAAVELGKLISHRGIVFRWEITLPAIWALSLLAAWPEGGSTIWPFGMAAGFWFVVFTSLLLLGMREILSGFREQGSFATIAASFLSVFMLGGIGTFLFMLRNMPDGHNWWIILFGFNWMYDAAALFGGKYFGKRPLAPLISPAKTMEGFLIGLATNAVVAVIVFYVWLPESLGISLPFFIILGVVLGVLGQAGDLMESMIKRWSGKKDASGIIPGHGGVLDKIDNLCFTAPVLFCLAWWLTHS
ncbi:phosphatidate cytidylyltransferase [bacterium]|nr:phosphatidate cytidylyltransferase [bacterium]